MMTCIIIEDQPHAQRILERYIGDIDSLELMGTFGDGLSALNFLNGTVTDLIFLDIHLPKLSGIDFLGVLKYHPKIIFTTAFSEYALKGYELDAVDYLLKPFSFKRFLQAVTKAERLITNEPKGTPQNEPQREAVLDKLLFIKSGTEYLKIETNQIKYIQANGDYTTIFTNQSKVMASQSLKHWLQHLASHQFYQIHKSYIVNIHAVRKISGNQVYIDENKLPIGRTFRESFFAHCLDKKLFQ